MQSSHLHSGSLIYFSMRLLELPVIQDCWGTVGLGFLVGLKAGPIYP